MKVLEKNHLSINDTAIRLNVSTATIRNWVKIGYLEKIEHTYICIKSIKKFEETIAGKEKLNTRANKSLYDTHDHQLLSHKIINKLNTKTEFIDNIGIEYEKSLSNSYKNKEGIYYTPTNIVKDMLKNIDDTKAKTFLDPSCGSGNFILEAIKCGISPELIFGFDIDPIAVEITKNRIYRKTGYKTKNIKVFDFLEHSCLIKENFDYIFTNPPWGKKIKKEKKEKIGVCLNAQKCLDTSALFFFASIKLLKENGLLGYLLPEAFFNISVFEEARKKALENKILRLIDYGKIFKGLMTKAQAIILQKRKYIQKKTFNVFTMEQNTKEKNHLLLKILN